MLATLEHYDRAPRVLRLNVSGQPVEWVSWQEAVCLYARELQPAISSSAVSPTRKALGPLR